MPDIVRTFLNMPLFAVLLGAGVVLSAVLAAPLARKMQEPWLAIFGLGVSLSLVLAATLSPASGESGACLRAIVRPLGPNGVQQWTDSRALNTWMLVPLGMFAGYLAVRRWWILVLAFAVPFVVEGVQRYVGALGRRCQFQDLIDNTWGLVLGASLGVLVGFAALGMRRRR